LQLERKLKHAELTSQNHIDNAGRHRDYLVPYVSKNSGFPGDTRQRLGFNPSVGKISWRRVWKPTPVFLSRESLGQRNLEGYSP